MESNCFLQKLDAEYSRSSGKFKQIYVSRRVDGREITSEFLEPLKKRFENVGREISRLLKHMRFLHAYYRVLEYTESLNRKKKLMKSGDSLTSVKRWIKEYEVSLLILKCTLKS